MTASSDSRTAKETQKTYLSIKQPPFRPPPYVFGPAWTLLYGLMGYAAHRAITAGLNPLTSTPQLIKETKHSATLYTIQLGLNRKHCSSFPRVPPPLVFGDVPRRNALGSVASD